MQPRTQATSSSTADIRTNFDLYIKLLEEANALLSTKNFAGALDKYQEAIKDCDFLPDAHIGSARVYSQLKQKDDAIKAYRKAIEYSPEHITAMKELANILINTNINEFKTEILKVKKIQEKIAVFRNDYFLDVTLTLKKYIEGKDPSDVVLETIYLEKSNTSNDPSLGAQEDAYLGNIALTNHRIAAAIYHFKRAQDTFRFDFYSQTKLSYIYLKHLNNPEAAIASALLAKIYNHPMANFYLGLTKVAQKYIGAAKDYFGFALAQAEIYHFPDIAKESLGEILKCIYSLKKISLRPTDEEINRVEKELKNMPEITQSTSKNTCAKKIQALTHLLNKDIFNYKIYAKLAQYGEHGEEQPIIIMTDLTIAALLAYNQGDIEYAKNKIVERNRIRTSKAKLVDIMQYSLDLPPLNQTS